MAYFKSNYFASNYFKKALPSSGAAVVLVTPQVTSGSRRYDRDDLEAHTEQLQYLDYLKRTTKNNNALILLITTGI